MSLELWTLVIGIVTAMSCALCGCLLLVNGKALVSEGLSHAVLPGLAVAFWYLGDYNSPLLIVSAAASGLFMVWCTELLQRTGLLDSDAALGLVFAGMFSLGILFISNFLKQTHFHADCILDGNLAIAALDRFEIAGWDLGPFSWVVMLAILIAQLLFILVCYKELKVALFDPELGNRFGLRPQVFQLGWLTIVSLTTVAAFNVAGSVLIVGLMIAPPAAAYLVTNRLHSFLVVSVGVGIVSAITGFYGALSLDVAPTGPIASAAGLVFLFILLFSPRNGLLANRWLLWRRNRESLDCLVLQWIEDGVKLDPFLMPGKLGRRSSWDLALKRLLNDSLVEKHADGYRLTFPGRKKLTAMIDQLQS